MLYKAWSVLSKELNQSVPNFTSFLKSLKEFHFLKGAHIISLSLAPTIGHMAKHIGKATACTFYAILKAT